MNTVLAGGGIGIIGILGGAVLALYFRAKYEKARGDAKLFALRLNTEEREHATTLKAAVRHAEEFADELERKTEVIKMYKDRSERLRVRAVETASHVDLLALANSLSMGVPNTRDTRTDRQNKSGDDIETVH